MTIPSGEQSDPGRVEIRANVVAPPMAASVSIEVIPTDDVQVEESPTHKYFRLRNVDYECFRRVFLN